jgi:3-deoxy-D-manno-octulosonic-acid transferase
MYLLYSLLLTFGFVLFLPKFVIDALRTRKYVTGLGERLGKLRPLPSSAEPVIWLHCVSVGETEAARPLVNALRRDFPAHQLVISTTTVTGQKVARAAFGDKAVAIIYFPIDWKWSARRALNAFRPVAVLIMETELWPNFLRECKNRTIPVAVVNGRISANSFKRYLLIRSFMRRVLNHLAVALMQSTEDAARIRELGLAESKVLVSGNIKFDSTELAVDARLSEKIRERFGVGENLIVAASTHAPEESVLIDAFKLLENPKATHVRMLIAPRHPERFEQVAALLAASGLSWSRRSGAPREGDRNCEVVLLDSIGELRAVYPLAAIAFVGGSIARHGGHNVLEPAGLGVCVITGAHVQNFSAITKAFLDAGAMVQLPDLPDSEIAAVLAKHLTNLLADERKRSELSRRGLEVCDRNRGATDRTLQIVAGLLAPAPPTGKTLPLSVVQLDAAE